QEPEVSAVYSFCINRKSGGLKRIQIPVNGSLMAIQIFCQIRDGFSVPGGDECLKNLLLPC
ncbi:MAG: hypothetical protein PVI71_15870, partial [Desulfobacterales bacterium]